MSKMSHENLKTLEKSQNVYYVSRKNQRLCKISECLECQLKNQRLQKNIRNVYYVRHSLESLAKNHKMSRMSLKDQDTLENIRMSKMSL